MGVMDNSGLAVSFIQSIYHEFGSGVVLPDTGIVWQNRGASFSLDPVIFWRSRRANSLSIP
jgi:gamma-glutamyltranspeptidase/glutathione hydrolase